MSASTLKPVDIKPITGFLDLRSSPDEVPFGGYRWVLNAGVVQKNKLCRAVGFRKLMDGLAYNNTDFHDQLGPSQFVSMLFVAEQRGYSKLFVGTQNKIAALNTETGNWKVISDQLGGVADPNCSEKRFYAASQDSTVVFTNGVDKPVYHIIDQPPIEPLQQSVRTIPDLETLHVTKVGRVFSWAGLMFYCNLEVDGQRETNLVMWSDYRRPISLIPSSTSLAGRKFLDDGEVVLNAAPMDKQLLIYTTRGIYVVSVMGDSSVLAFTKRWSGDRPGDRCLVYPNTLVSIGARHFYFGGDGLYAYDFYMQEPTRIDWVHRASSRIFDDINTAKCSIHVGGYNQRRKEIWWSWAKVNDECPSETFVINTEFPFSSYQDAGFSAFVNWGPDVLKTLRAFLLEHCICSTAELNTYNSGFTKEGGFCSAPIDPVCGIRPQSFFTNNPVTSDDVTTENFAQTDADPDSLWTLLGDVAAPSLCDAEALTEQCNAGELFVMASTKDKCLKEFADIFYREICTFNGTCATYQKQGYQTILRSGPNDLGEPNTKKIIEGFVVEASTIEQTVPSKLQLRVGVSSNAEDPNVEGGKCVIMWQEQDALPLECQSDQTAAEHLADGTYPDFGYIWPPFLSGIFFYYELTVLNDEVVPADTGGAMCMSRISFLARLGSD